MRCTSKRAALRKLLATATMLPAACLNGILHIAMAQAFLQTGIATLLQDTHLLCSDSVAARPVLAWGCVLSSAAIDAVSLTRAAWCSAVCPLKSVANASTTTSSALSGTDSLAVASPVSVFMWSAALPAFCSGFFPFADALPTACLPPSQAVALRAGLPSMSKKSTNLACLAEAAVMRGVVPYCCAEALQRCASTFRICRGDKSPTRRDVLRLLMSVATGKCSVASAQQ